MDVLTTEEVAGLLRISPHTLRNWRRTGGGPEYMRFGRVVRYQRQAIERYMVECQSKAEQGPPPQP